MLISKDAFHRDNWVWCYITYWIDLIKTFHFKALTLFFGGKNEFGENFSMALGSVMQKDVHLDHWLTTVWGFLFNFILNLSSGLCKVWHFWLRNRWLYSLMSDARLLLRTEIYEHLVFNLVRMISAIISVHVISSSGTYIKPCLLW